MINFFRKTDPKTRNLEVGEFAHQHPDLIIIVADPKDDTIFVAHNDKFVSGRIRSAEGDKIHIVKDLLKQSTFNREIDKFLMSLADVMRIRKLSAGVNNVMQYIDGALYNISQRHRSKVVSKQVDSPKEGAIKSPFLEPQPVEPDK